MGRPPALEVTAALRPRHRRHRPWSLTLVVLHAVVLAVGLGLGGIGLWFIVTDLTRDRGDLVRDAGPWGVLLGMVLLAVALVVAVTAGALLVLTLVGRRRADRGLPVMLRVVAAVGLALALVALVVVVRRASDEPTLAAMSALLPLGYAAVAGVMLRTLTGFTQEA